MDWEAVIGWALLGYFGVAVGMILARPLIERFYRWLDRKEAERKIDDNPMIQRVVRTLRRLH